MHDNNTGGSVAFDSDSCIVYVDNAMHDSYTGGLVIINDADNNINS